MIRVVAILDRQWRDKMKAALKGLHSPDVELTSGVSVDERGSVLVQLMVGPADGPGEESFDVVVCNAEWLDQVVRERGSIFGRHYLFVDRIERGAVESAVTDYLSALEGASWQELAQQIGRVAKWEFEDYRE